ncbi:MAG TPA: hypothetical protein DDZ62_01635 [Delftia acidovorans]|jgi:hypothetical protein|uniref:hypothetical protein n=1 Tax=Delftia acidovorans TaxID=80866 RepID=UPI000353C582|nr:hypothetical protein [Delftia acidovorans]EPD44611.1 hypothetical protein HMPREF9701_00195 [Delftia acidovorans CCUG 274B]HBJ98800.1 hypothetical protein [Delftia acidovorans]
MSSNQSDREAPENSGLVPLPLRVTQERKARWVQQSRAEGKKLTDWIVERVERANPTSDQRDRK